MTDNRERQPDARGVRRVGIVTLHTYWVLHNFGTFFQHWALRRALTDFGCAPFRVCPNPFGSRFALPLAICAAAGRALGAAFSLARPSRIISPLSYCFRREAPTIRCFRELIGPLDESAARRNCHEFLVGGDQVWYDYDGAAWGDGLPSDSQLAAFAVSADWKRATETDAWQRAAAAKLSRFQRVFVRERTGAEIVRRLAPAGLEIGIAPDPVLLHDRETYAALLPRTKRFTKPTLVAYIVNWHRREDAYLDELEAVARARAAELAVIAGQGAERLVPARCRCDCDPRGFIHAVRDADAIITNSFHGIVFAMIFGRPFAYVPQRNLSGQDQNVRQRELLAAYGLGERECAATKDAITAAIAAPLSGDLAAKLAAAREAGRRALLQCLEAVGSRQKAIGNRQ